MLPQRSVRLSRRDEARRPRPKLLPMALPQASALRRGFRNQHPVRRLRQHRKHWVRARANRCTKAGSLVSTGGQQCSRYPLVFRVSRDRWEAKRHREPAISSTFWGQTCRPGRLSKLVGSCSRRLSSFVLESPSAPTPRKGEANCLTKSHVVSSAAQVPEDSPSLSTDVSGRLAALLSKLLSTEESPTRGLGIRQHSFAGVR